MPHIRTIFIGLGGAGIQTIDLLKQKYLASNNGKLPESIKFLAIDSDYNITETGFTHNEFVLIRSHQAYERYLLDTNSGVSYNIPESNVKDLWHLHGFGCGMCRSNGKYLFRINEQKILSRINSLYKELFAAPSNEWPNIDVHIISSSCGGTGSGIFLELSKLVRQIIPNSRIFLYLYSDSFYTHIVHITCREIIRQNARASILEMKWEKDIFDFCTWVGSVVGQSANTDNYIIPLEDAINRLAEVLIHISEEPYFYSWFETLRNAGQICNLISLGCHKLVYDREFILQRLAENVLQKACEIQSPSCYKDDITSILNELIEPIRCFGENGYNAYYQNIALFEQTLNDNVTKLIAQCAERLTDKTNSNIIHSNGFLRVIIRELNNFRQDVFAHIKDYSSEIEKCHSEILKLKNEIDYIEHKLFVVNRHVRLADLNDRILALSYSIKTNEIIIKAYEEFDTLISSISYKMERLVDDFEWLRKGNNVPKCKVEGIIKSNVTSYIDINTIHFKASASEIFKDLFAKGLDSVIDETRFREILQEHISEETLFNKVPDIGEILRMLRSWSSSMEEERCIQGLPRIIEEMHLFYPQDLSNDFLQIAGNYFRNNVSFVVNSNDEVVMVYKRGFDSYECVLNDKANIAQLKYSDSYSPFSCSIFEQRFREEYNHEKDN